MKLHKDKVTFEQAVRRTSNYYKIEPALIEKDYYITLVLYKINKYMPGLIFKGGTSLSKCYKIINRFSEDIDLTLDRDHFTQSNRQKLKNVIIDVCKELNLFLTNENDIKSRRAYNCYHIEYPMNFSSPMMNPQLIIETVFIQKSYPDETKIICSLISGWLQETNQQEVMEQYDLLPFKIKVQTIERTMIDKVFAVCDYMLKGIFLRQSRHIYDISQLVPHIKLDENLKTLVNIVKKERKKSKACLSSQDGLQVSKLLRQMIDTQFFKKDYEENTLKLIFQPISYEEAIQAIEIIISSGVFE